jgi:hypothetical protein
VCGDSEHALVARRLTESHVRARRGCVGTIAATPSSCEASGAAAVGCGVDVPTTACSPVGSANPLAPLMASSASYESVRTRAQVPLPVRSSAGRGEIR